MNSFSLAFSVVCPLFFMMALGYFLRRIGLFTEDFLRQLNGLCFKVFLPAILFIDVYDSDFSNSFQPKLVGFAMLSILVIFLVLMFLVPRFERDNRRRSVLIQGIFRSNFILFGLPITTSLFGAEKAGATAILIAFIVPLLNLLAVITLEYFQNGKVNIRRTLVRIVTNPLIIGAMTAFVFVLLGVKLPHVLDQTVRDISKIATPLTLITLGGSFVFSSLGHNWKALVAAVGSRLILVPLCGLPLAIALGFRGAELGGLLALFATPVATSSFTMAQQMGADDELAGQIVVMGSLCSVVTIFGWISVLSQSGFLQLLP